MVVPLKYLLIHLHFSNQMPGSCCFFIFRSTFFFSGVHFSFFFFFALTLLAPCTNRNTWCSHQVYTRKGLAEELPLLFYKSDSGVGTLIHGGPLLLPPQDMFYWPIYYAFISLRVNRNTLFVFAFIHRSTKSTGTKVTWSCGDTRADLTEFTLCPAMPGILLQTSV